MKNIKFIIIGIIIVVLVFLFARLIISQAEATNIQVQSQTVCFCHNINNNPTTICTSNNALKVGHSLHVAQGNDSFGSCQEVTLTPTPTPVEEEECVPYELAHVLDENEEYCEPEVTPTPEVTPVPQNPSTDHVNRAGEAPGVCSATIPNSPANPLVWRKGGQAIVQWVPDSTVNQARIYWMVNGQATWMYSLTTANTGYVVINDLGANDVTFGVAQFNGCNESQIITIVDGDTEGWVLFTP